MLTVAASIPQCTARQEKGEKNQYLGASLTKEMQDYTYAPISLSKHPSTEHLGCSHVLATVNDAARNTGMEGFVGFFSKTLISLPVDTIPEVAEYLFSIV